MREIVCTQRSDEWYAARAGYITASQMHKVFAKGKTKSEEAVTRRDYKMQLVAERLTGRSQESDFMDSSMQWGNDNEAAARAAYEAETGNIVTEHGFIVHDYMMVGVSIDGRTENGLIEIKCPKTATHLETFMSSVVPSKYMLQMQTQMWITEDDECDFVSFDLRLPPKYQIKIITVQRDKSLIKKIEQECQQFDAEIESFIRALTM